MTHRNGTGATHREHCPVGMETHKDPETVRSSLSDCESEDRCPDVEPGQGVVSTGVAEAPDGGWGWVVLSATVLVLALTLAFPSCVGIFYTDLQHEFSATNSQTSWVPSIMTSVLHAGGPFCSVLVERFGCRATVMFGGVLSGFGMAASSFTQSIGQLYVTAGVITGLGFCFSFQPAVTILGHYFVRRRAFANAVSSTGTALGLCTLPGLGHYLHLTLGWRGSFLVLGAVLLNCCVCGAVMRPPHTLQQQQHTHGRGPPLIRQAGEGGGKKDTDKKSSMWGAVRSRVLSSLGRHMAFDQLRSNPRYRAYSLGITWMMLGFVVPLVYLVPYAEAHGMPASRAALLLSILGVVNIVVRPAFGLLFSLPWFKGRHVYVFASALLVNGLSNSICCAGPGFGVLLGYVLAFGLSMSVVGSLMFTVLMEVVEMRRFPSALGLLAIMESVTLLIGPPLAGVLVDRTGHYYLVFFACSAVVASAAIFLIVSFYWLDERDRKCVSQKRKTSSSAAHSDPAARANANASASVSVAPDCQYSKVPTEGEREKTSAANGTEHSTSL